GAQVRRAAARDDPLVDIGIEGDDADLVLHPVADIADEDRGVDGVVEPGDLRYARGHAVALVEAEQDVLRPVETELAHDEPAVAGGGPPGDIAVIIVGDVIAQPVELAPLAEAGRLPCADPPQGIRVEL